MNVGRRRIADELYAVGHAHDQTRSDRLERLRNVEPPTAELLGVLIRATGARRILELGTSNGYSTIWLADAAEATGGAVVSVDVDAVRTELANRYIANRERPLSVVAEMLGFSHSSAFSRWFKKRFGRSVSAWRADNHVKL